MALDVDLRSPGGPFDVELLTLSQVQQSVNINVESALTVSSSIDIAVEARQLIASDVSLPVEWLRRVPMPVSPPRVHVEARGYVIVDRQHRIETISATVSRDAVISVESIIGGLSPVRIEATRRDRKSVV